MKFFIKYLKNILPTPDEIKNNRSLKIFKNFFNNPNLWHMNKYSVSRAFAVGFFCAWIEVVHFLSITRRS